jgi:hypothetical protein
MLRKSVMSWQWIAGFFEGEGHVNWQERRKGKSGQGGRAIMGQVCKAPLESVYNFLKAEGFGEPSFYLRPIAKSARRNSQPCWILTVQKRADVIRFLEAIAPMLFDKRAKAEYVVMRLKAADAERERVINEAIKLRKEGMSWREISRLTGISRNGLTAHLDARGIDWRQKPGMDDMEWRDDRIARGLCESCGAERGENGTKRKCRPCADSYNQWRNQHRMIHGRKDRPGGLRLIA